MLGSAGAIVNHVTTQCQDQGQPLEDAKSDLEAFKKAYYKAEREMQDHAAKFGQEKQALHYEIHQLKVSHSPSDPMRSAGRAFRDAPPQADFVHDNTVMLIVPFPVRPQVSQAHERREAIFLPWSIAEGREGFEQEQQALSDEILRLRGYGVHGHNGRFKGNSSSWYSAPTMPPPLRRIDAGRLHVSGTLR